MGCLVSTDIHKREEGKCISTSYPGLGLCHLKKISRRFTGHGTFFRSLSSRPNRILQNGKSRSSCVFTQKGKKGVNQDSMIVWEDFMPEDMTLIGVFDGHGPNGHLVSHKVRDMLPLKLMSYISSCVLEERCSSVNCTTDISLDGRDLEDLVPLEDNGSSLWREAFIKSYKAMDKDLEKNPNLDCCCSGSTAVTIVQQGSNLYIGSIGDSRAIMGSKDDNDSMVATQLTVDQKPDLPKEAERIKRRRGRVLTLREDPEVARVWLPSEDAPGLAMSRSFGDFCLKDYGVISVPIFIHQTLTERDCFIVLASDGIWDVLSNEEVVEIVSSSRSRGSVSRAIVESAAHEWTKYPDSRMDDCTAVCFFLDGKMGSEFDYDEQRLSSATNQSSHSVHSNDDEPPLLRNFTTVRHNVEKETNTRVPSEDVIDGESAVCDEQDWSGLQDFTGVNSLAQHPKFS